MRTDQLDYELPPELIAAEPATRRDESRLLVLHRTGSGMRGIEHRRFSDLPEYLKPGDLLVVNDSRVLRARLRGVRVPSGGQVELLLLERISAAGDERDVWRAMARPAKRMQIGDALRFSGGARTLKASVVGVADEGIREIAFATGDLIPELEELGEMPLPPYIERRRRDMLDAGVAAAVDDVSRYQTVYAEPPGSVAAPTAGLHFTNDLLERLTKSGVELAGITLHVGAGTFKPVDAETLAEHPMHTERFSISADAATQVNRARREGRRIVAVGTTVVRALEAAAQESANDSSVAPDSSLVRAGDFTTQILIAPGHEFRVVKALITNFHLPRSTLLALVSAFARRDAVFAAYAEAIRLKYRFYSYGDAMLIV